MQYTYQEVFLLLNTVFELINFDAFQGFCHSFVSPLPYWQNVAL